MAVNDKSAAVLTLGRVARLLHFHSNTVRRWSDKGIIKPCYIAYHGAPRFKQADVAHLLLQVNGNGVSLTGA